MYRGVKTEQSCARAWAAAASEIIRAGDEGYNVIIDVEDPVTHDDQDNQVITLVDKFLRTHNENPIVTVANTIFPLAIYHEFKSPGTDLENGAILDREGRATRGDRVSLEKISACGHAARHAIKRAE
jgi:hypothetical protein